MFFLKKIPLSIITLALLCLTAALSWAQEQPQPAEPTSVIPYQGTLFSQGKPVSQTDPVKMAFAIYSDSAGLDAGASADAPALHRKWTSWSSTENVDDVVNADKTIDVQVRNGRFLAHLGEEEHGQQPLKDSTFTPASPVDDFYVVTWVVKDSGGVFRLPPQKLGKVPHAVTANIATSFEIHGNPKERGKIKVDSFTVTPGNTPGVLEGLTQWVYILEVTCPILAVKYPAAENRIIWGNDSEKVSYTGYSNWGGLNGQHLRGFVVNNNSFDVSNIQPGIVKVYQICED